jgi:hypothetical protein
MFTSSGFEKITTRYHNELWSVRASHVNVPITRQVRFDHNDEIYTGGSEYRYSHTYLNSRFATKYL